MDFDIQYLIMISLAVAWILVWLFFNRQIKSLNEKLSASKARASDAQQQHYLANIELARAEERIAQLDSVSENYQNIHSQYSESQQQLVSLRKELELQDKHLKLIQEARNELSLQFGEVGQQLLAKAHQEFLNRADQRFAQSEEIQEEKIKNLLSPVRERLKAYEESVGKVEKDRTEAYGNLTGLINQMREGQDRVQQEAARLVNSLRNAPKARGRWGEHQLRNVLESCGLAEHTDFEMEKSIRNEEGEHLRPDAIIHIPGGSILVVDAKVSLNAYQDSFDAEEDSQRHLHMAAHCKSMKTHIDGLSRRAYWSQFTTAPDYVIMFVPGEHFLSAALDHDPMLWDYAFDKKILLATPTNLVAIARTVASVWRQEGLADEVQKIGALGKEMYDRLAVAAEHLKRMGGNLDKTVKSYNQFVGSFERNVLSTGRRFADLNVDTGKRELERVDQIDALPRYTKDELSENAAETIKE